MISAAVITLAWILGFMFGEEFLLAPMPVRLGIVVLTSVAGFGAIYLDWRRLRDGDL
jgi:hypothetical protein